MDRPIESPCVNVCRLDDDSLLCVGCLRTGMEIACWRSMSAAERREVMRQLPQRRTDRCDRRLAGP